jgi:hypothetical protein
MYRIDTLTLIWVGTLFEPSVSTSLAIVLRVLCSVQ